MPKAISVLLAGILLLSACDSGLSTEVRQAREQYQQTQDYASLEVLHQQLEKGMQQGAVQSLLGEAVYSPIEGVDYYPAGKAGMTQQASLGLVVEYINEQGEATQQVQQFWLGEVGE